MIVLLFFNVIRGVWIFVVELKLLYHISAPADAPVQELPPLILVSFGLIFELVFPESTSEGGRPHMQGRPGGEREEEEEGNLETEPIHHAAGERAEGQLPQNLQSRQETVMGRLEDGGRVER